MQYVTQRWVSRIYPAAPATCARVQLYALDAFTSLGSIHVEARKLIYLAWSEACPISLRTEIRSRAVLPRETRRPARLNSPCPKAAAPYAESERNSQPIGFQARGQQRFRFSPAQAGRDLARSFHFHIAPAQAMGRSALAGPSIYRPLRERQTKDCRSTTMRRIPTYSCCRMPRI